MAERCYADETTRVRWQLPRLGVASCPARARAQNPDEIMPDVSAAKAKAILQQAIDGLGGAAYVNVHNSECTGRYAQFQHSGEIGGYLQIREYREMPDKSD